MTKLATDQDVLKIIRTQEIQMSALKHRVNHTTNGGHLPAAPNPGTVSATGGAGNGEVAVLTLEEVRHLMGLQHATIEGTIGHFAVDVEEARADRLVVYVRPREVAVEGGE